MGNFSEQNDNNRPRGKRWLPAIIVIVLVIFIPMLSKGILSNAKSENKIDLNNSKLGVVLNTVQNKYPFEIDEEKLVDFAIKGMLSSLDDYSSYYTKEEGKQFKERLSGKFMGIGVSISKNKENGGIDIKDVFEDAPSMKAGLLKGDIIIAVAGESILEMDLAEAIDLIKGPEGTSVDIKIMRGKKELEFKVERAEIKVDPIKYEMMDEIAYIRISDFNDLASKNLNIAMKKLKLKENSKLIIDLRGNGGGSLEQACKIADVFVNKGPIVYMKDKGGIHEYFHSTGKAKKYEMVILVDEDTASASEIVAGAIKESMGSTIVGKTTFGKGVAQSIYEFNDDSLYKITSSEWLTPNKKSIDGVGITPDVDIDNAEDEDGNIEDLQLEKALEILKGKKVKK